LFNVASKLFGKFFIITTIQKSIWYRLGLALAEGHPENRSNTFDFGSTRASLGYCILIAWREVSVTLHNGFYVDRRRVIVPSLRYTVKDYELRRLIGDDIVVSFKNNNKYRAYIPVPCGVYRWKRGCNRNRR